MQSFNYNALEMFYLVTSMFILLSGMAFQSNVAVSGGTAHTALTWVVALVLITSVLAFFGILALEVWRSVVFARKASAAVKRTSVAATEGDLTSNRDPGLGDLRWQSNPVQKALSLQILTHAPATAESSPSRMGSSQTLRRARILRVAQVQVIEIQSFPNWSPFPSPPSEY